MWLFFGQIDTKNYYHAVHCTHSIEETKELSLSLYSDSMGVNKGKRPSLYSDKHGGVKVFTLYIICMHVSSREQWMVDMLA